MREGSEIRYTLGPWFVSMSNPYNADIYSAKFESIARVPIHYHGNGPVEQLVNAHLMSAAPEMLEALEELMKSLRVSNQSHRQYRVLKALCDAQKAVRKANGRSDE